MPTILTDPAAFRAHRAWGARDLAEIDGATVRLHWTDEAYKWHRNDGTEVFVVLNGVVNMHYRLPGGPEEVVRLEPGALFVAEEGEEHVARPEGEARILVIERKGSI